MALSQFPTPLKFRNFTFLKVAIWILKLLQTSLTSTVTRMSLIFLRTLNAYYFPARVACRRKFSHRLYLEKPNNYIDVPPWRNLQNRVTELGDIRIICDYPLHKQFPLRKVHVSKIANQKSIIQETIWPILRFTISDGFCQTDIRLGVDMRLSNKRSTASKHVPTGLEMTQHSSIVTIRQLLPDGWTGPTGTITLPRTSLAFFHWRRKVWAPSNIRLLCWFFSETVWLFRHIS